jgi:hypothetical protein
MMGPILTTADALASTTRALAVVTGVLALATVALAVITICGIRSARADARKQLAASYRPVLAPLQRSGETVTYRGGQILISTGPHTTENPPDRQDQIQRRIPAHRERRDRTSAQRSRHLHRATRASHNTVPHRGHRDRRARRRRVRDLERTEPRIHRQRPDRLGRHRLRRRCRQHLPHSRHLRRQQRLQVDPRGPHLIGAGRGAMRVTSHRGS